MVLMRYHVDLHDGADGARFDEMIGWCINQVGPERLSCGSRLWSEGQGWRAKIVIAATIRNGRIRRISMRSAHDRIGLRFRFSFATAESAMRFRMTWT